MKYFVVSDVHDHFRLMTEALERQGFEKENPDHKLIICGDAFYSGPQPGELFEYLKELDSKGKFIFLYGNHDLELLDNLSAGRFGRTANRVCIQKLVKYFTGREGLADDELIEESNRLCFTGFLHNAIPYFETEHYVFVHGFIPTVKNKYDEHWRDKLNSGTGPHGCATADGMKHSMLHGISEPGKTIVFGHLSAARCYLMRNSSAADWENRIYKSVASVPIEGFRPYYGKTFIAIDASVKKSGFVNCIVLEDGSGLEEK